MAFLVAWITAVLMLLNSQATVDPNVYTLNLTSVEELDTYFAHVDGRAPLVSAHRGGQWPGYAENSIEALGHTLTQMPAMFEVDPHLTSDGQVVAMHDQWLSRTTTGSGLVRHSTMAQIAKLNFEDFWGRPAPGHPVTVSEMIDWARGRTVLNLDVYDVPPSQRVGIVKEAKAFGHVVFTAQSPAQAREILALAPQARLSAWVLDRDTFDEYERIGWDSVAIAYLGPELTATARRTMGDLHDRGVSAMIATAASADLLTDAVDRRAVYRSLAEAGVDVIESDRPLEVHSAVHDVGAESSEAAKDWRRPVGRVQG